MPNGDTSSFGFGGYLSFKWSRTERDSKNQERETTMWTLESVRKGRYSRAAIPLQAMTKWKAEPWQPSEINSGGVPSAAHAAEPDPRQHWDSEQRLVLECPSSVCHQRSQLFICFLYTAFYRCAGGSHGSGIIHNSSASPTRAVVLCWAFLWPWHFPASGNPSVLWDLPLHRRTSSCPWWLTAWFCYTAVNILPFV